MKTSKWKTRKRERDRMQDIITWGDLQSTQICCNYSEDIDTLVDWAQVNKRAGSWAGWRLGHGWRQWRLVLADYSCSGSASPLRL